MVDHTMRAWKCPQGHVLGQVFRNGSGVRQLALYRLAVDPSEGGTPAPPPAPPHFQEQNGEGNTTGMGEVDVMAVVEGYVADVRCSICGEVRTWVPGEESLRLMLERRRQNISMPPR